MKAIINNKRYNTETATAIEENSNGLGSSDFKNFSETLYRTKNGAWFLHGSGGAMSRYSTPVGNMRGGGEKIIPLSTEEAREWLENINAVESLEKHFKPVDA